MSKPGSSPILKWTGTKGDDTYYVASNDALASTTIDGAAGNDTLNLSGLSGGVSIDLILGNPGSSRVWANTPFHGSWWSFVSGGPGGTVVDGTIKNVERIAGTNFNDYLAIRGGTVSRVADGGGGDDAIYITGSGGTSTAIGGAGSDQLFGTRNGDLLIGGTYNSGVAPGDDTTDSFTVGAGTILDFEVGVDKLYLDIGGTTSAIWSNVTVAGYGNGARLTIDATHVITLIGVDASTMNAMPLGYVLSTNSGQVTSGAGDDFIAINISPGADHLIFPAGSGHDEVVGFNVGNDSLTFSTAPTFTQTSYHGDSALLATYDGGASTVLLIGLSMADVSSLHIDWLG